MQVTERNAGSRGTARWTRKTGPGSKLTGGDEGEEPFSSMCQQKTESTDAGVDETNSQLRARWLLTFKFHVVQLHFSDSFFQI